MSVLKDLAAKYGMSVRGLQAWGTVDGFWFEIEMPQNSAQTLKIRTAVQFPDEAAAHDADTAFAAAMRENSAIRFERNGGAITLHRKMPFAYRSLKAQDVETLMQKAAMILRGAGATPGCFRCGANSADSFAMIDGLALKYCNKCLSETENSLEQRKEEYKTVENNYLRGILGAVIGALIGSIVWILLGMLGRVAVIGGMAISFGAIKGYTLFKGKITRPAILIACLVSLAFFFVAEFFLYDIAIYKVLLTQYQDVNFWSTIPMVLSAIFTNGEITGEFLQNCPLGFLFLAAGAFIVIRPYFSKASAPAGKVERL